ncbi:MAG: hypothetical protein RIB84_12140 [Sneathiellaceae bacterium]
MSERMPRPLEADVQSQLDDLHLVPDRPLVITDADEVLFQFMKGLEGYLTGQELYFDWASFALYGNIRRRSDDSVVEMPHLADHLDAFFAAHAAELEAVEGAAAALAGLAERAQIVVLSNIPLPQRDARLQALRRNGMDYPLVANRGPKGAAVHQMAARVAAPAVFIDDIPQNHKSVRATGPGVHCLHFVADRRLAALLGPSEHCDATCDSWPDLRRAIEGHFAAQGF